MTIFPGHLKAQEKYYNGNIKRSRIFLVTFFLLHDKIDDISILFSWKRGKKDMAKTKAGGYGRAAVIMCALCMGFSGCTADDEEEETGVQIEAPQESSYTMVVASMGNVVKTGRVRCTYMQTDEEEIRITTKGSIMDSVYVSLGDSVVKGQLLAELAVDVDEDDIAELEYRIARNSLLLGYTDTDENYALSNRWWSFVYQSSGSESEQEKLDKALENIRQTYRYKREDYQDAIELDRQQLEDMQRQIEESRLYAGIDGEISYVGTQLEGSRVTEGQIVLKIIDNSRCLFEVKESELKGEFPFKEGEALRLTVGVNGRSVETEVLPYDMEHWDDVYYFELPEILEGLKVGTSGIIYYTVDSRESVLTLPHRVIRNADGKQYVYVLGENDIRQVRWIETGLWGDTLVEVVSGLEEGEYVVQK